MVRTTQRLFVALSIPSRERKKIHKVAEPLREDGLPVRWVDPTLYHITVKYLGDVRSEQIDEISETLERVASENQAFQAEMDRFGAFPTLRKPQVLWLGVDPNPALRCLKHDVEWSLSKCGFDRDSRAFHPHLTLGRVGKTGTAGAFRGFDEKAAELTYHGSFAVPEVHLMRSQYTSSGPRYSVVSKSRLN
jgi:2'-5' RNA ligase